MSENEFKPDQPPSEGTPKPYEQFPDEPDKWFDRFQRYCQMGPSRDLLRLYRQVMHERDDRQAAASAEPFSESLTGLGSQVRHLSGAWRQKVKEFNWDERALTWDDDRRQIAFKQDEGLLNNIIDATINALQILIDMMNRVVQDADGTVIMIVDPYQIRMAAKTVLSKGLVAIPLLMTALSSERPEIPITNIFALQSGGQLTPDHIEEGEKNSPRRD